MFYATHKCGKVLLIDELEGYLVARGLHQKSSQICSQCEHLIKTEDLSPKSEYVGVEIVSYEGNEPEYQCSNGSLDNATLRIDGGMYVFCSEWSGKRGTYNQWSRTWVSKPISEDGITIPNPHKVGSSYWNDHCWFPIEPTHHQGEPDNFNSLVEVVEIVRQNADEIARRAADEKYQAG